MEVVYVATGEALADRAGDFIEVIAQWEAGTVGGADAHIRCCYTVNDNKVEFRKVQPDVPMSFEDALAWARSFAAERGIPTVYAVKPS